MDYTIRIIGAENEFGSRELHIAHAQYIDLSPSGLTFFVGDRATIIPLHRLHSITYSTPVPFPKLSKTPLIDRYAFAPDDEPYDGAADSLSAQDPGEAAE